MSTAPSDPTGPEATGLKATSEKIDKILAELEKAYTYYHKSHDASAGFAKRNAKQDLLELFREVRIEELEKLKTANGYHEGDWMESIKDRIEELRKRVGL